MIGDDVDEEDVADEPVKPKIARFTREEGIPMVLCFEDRGGRTSILVSIDGAPEMRLRQVAGGVW